MPTALITGANRGLGFALTEAYAADGWRVLACARAPEGAAELQKIAAGSRGRVTLHRLDVEDHVAIDHLGVELRGTPIDVLLNVAGVGSTSGFGETKLDEWQQVYRVNVIGPMKMSETFVENVAASAQKKIVSLTSNLGSIADANWAGMYPYRASKAALNMVMKTMAVELKPRGIIAIPLHPGWVRTDMGGPNAEIEPEESVRGMRKVIAGLRPDDSGVFFVYDGRTMPW